MRSSASSPFIWFALGAALVACNRGAMTSPSQGTTLANGSWGGDQARLVVQEDRAELELSCAHGKIEEPLVVSSSGRFEWKGTFTQERGGPTPEGDDRAAAAFYAGTLDGDTLVLSVRVDAAVAVNSIRLTRGRNVRIIKCA